MTKPSFVLCSDFLAANQIRDRLPLMSRNDKLKLKARNQMQMKLKT